MSFLTLAFAQLWHVFNMRDPRSPLLVNEVTRNPFVWGAVALGLAIILLVLVLPVTAPVLGLALPGRTAWGLILTMSLMPLVLGQIGLALSRRIPARHQPHGLVGPVRQTDASKRG